MRQEERTVRVLLLWAQAASLFLKGWNEKGMNGGRMMLRKVEKRQNRVGQWMVLSRGGRFLKREGTVGLLNGAFFCFFQREAWRRRELAGEKAVRRGKG